MNSKTLFLARKDEIRKRLVKYTRKAFRMLPKMENPRILDIGCGSGIPTLELLKLSQAHITAIDIDQASLNRLNRKLVEARFTDRVRVINMSIFKMDFQDSSFDIIWAEGSIFIPGFEAGLRDWKRLLRPGGYLIVHDELREIQKKLENIRSGGYELLGYFILGVRTWKREYFTPLEKLISEFEDSSADPGLLEELGRASDEVDIFRHEPERNSSIYFVMKLKRES